MSNNINNGNLSKFEDMIRRIVKDEIQKFAKENLEIPQYGIITAIDTVNNRADVDLASSVAKGLLNKTGLTLGTSTGNLKVGDSVKIYKQGGNLTDAYIGLKCGN